jgi:hypothetical protein
MRRPQLDDGYVGFGRAYALGQERSFTKAACGLADLAEPNPATGVAGSVVV